MSDYAPPTGPPPPRAPEVPAGWTARWNDQYKEWFYVNIYTKQSQWEKPTEPVYPPHDDNAPLGAPPSYQPGNSPAPSDVKTNPYQQHGAGTPGAGSSSRPDEDARLAAELQAQEDARSRSTGPGGPHPPPGYGSSSPYPQNANPNPQSQGYPTQLPPREQKKSGSFLGKLLSKGSSRVGGAGQYGPPQQSYYGGHHGPPQGGYPGAPMGGGYPGGHMGGGYGQPHYPQGHYGGGYPPQMAYGRGGRSGGGGMGMAGGAALGVGAGMLGGYMIADAINDGQQDAYAEGYQDGAGGDDFDGGDFE